MRSYVFRRGQLTAALLILATGVAGPAGAQSAGEILGVTGPVRLTYEDLHPTRAYQSPSLLPVPASTGTIVAAGVDMSTSTCHLFRSTDFGQTWSKLEATPSPDTQPLCFDGAIYGYHNETPVAWGRGGEVLYWAITGAGGGGPEDDVGVLVARSRDQGDSWESSVVTPGLPAGTFARRSRPITALAVDDRSGPEDIVYVGWETYPEEGPRAPAISVSTDGGRTFSEPRLPFDAGASERFGGSGGLQGLPPQLAVSDAGSVYVLYGGQAGGEEGPDEVPNRLLLARSDDRGQSFTVTEVSEVRDANVGPSFAWSPAGGEDGTLHIVYEDRRDEPYGPRDIIYQRSVDGGQTFSEPRMLNDDDPSLLLAQVNPNISLAPGGRIDVAWWDWRDGAAAYGNDVYYTYSADGGDSWSDNVRVTDRSIDRRVGYWGNNSDMRSRPGIASTDDVAVLAWSDTRLADGLSQTQDMFSAAVQFRELSSARSEGALRYLPAVVAGVLLSGVVLAGLALMRGRRAEESRPA